MARFGSGRASRARARAVVLLMLVACFVLSLCGVALAGTIHGTVRSAATGDPVAGIKVLPYRLLEGTMAWVAKPGAVMLTTVGGAYTITVPDAGQYTLQFTDPAGLYMVQEYKDKHELGVSDAFAVGAGESVAVDDVLLDSPAGSIEGTLTDAVTGDGIEAQVALMLRMTNGAWKDLYGVTGSSDASGHLRVVGLPPGKYRIRITPKPSLLTSGYPTLYYSAAGTGGAPTAVRVLPGEAVTGCDMQLARADTAITGRVVDASTQTPIRDLKVEYYYLGAGEGLFVGRVWTGVDGRFTAPDLIPGRYKLDFMPENAATCARESTTTAAGVDLDVRLPVGASISGTIADSVTGTTTASVLVRAFEYVDGVATGYFVAANTLADGSYTIKWAKPGTYRLMVTGGKGGDFACTTYPDGPGLATGVLGQSITLAEAEATAGIDAELIPGGHITGTLTDSASGLAAGIMSVRCYTLVNGEWTSVGKSDTATRLDGSYDVGGLYPGAYRIRFTDPNSVYADRFYAGVASASSIASATDVVVGRGETVEGMDGLMGGAVQGEGTATMTVETTGAPATVTLNAGTPQTDGLMVAFADAGLGGQVSAWPMELIETPVPEGVTILGNVLDISTNALFDGTIEITMPYDEATLRGPEADVKLYHYVDGAWVDITVSVDTTANTVTGRTTSLSPIAQVGAELVAVPPTVGMTEAAARDAILAAGLVVGRVTLQFSDTVGAGRVISQTPTGITGRGDRVDLVVSKGRQARATVYRPVAPSTARRGRSFTVYGYVAPRHASGTYLVTLQFFIRNSSGVYVYHHSVKARRYYYSATKTKYKATVSLPHSGRWRVWAYHSDSAHGPSYSGYDYIMVR
jgi:5-hydroxyisourate hydrolase-like protein (transthyretin family)